MKRRDFVKTTTMVGIGGAAGVSTLAAGDIERLTASSSGRVNHSVCQWCFSMMSVDELAALAKQLGIISVELLGPDDWPVLSKYDLTCAMANPPGDVGDKLVRGFSQVEHHDRLVGEYLDYLPLVANAGFPNVICFSGNRFGLDDEQGLENCVSGLQRILPTAEKLGVTICMELLNSRVDHKDYQCDRTEWGVELVKRLGSDRFKLLYDIYHMQIMEGDIIRTIRDNHEYIGHYHTAGVPGRNEIDETQELNYAAIIEAIVETGFDGYIAQEFIPKRDPARSLREAIVICDV